MSTPKVRKNKSTEIFAGRAVAVCVTGSIAAYKAADLCRRFVKRGLEVRPVMTETALRFIGPATFSGITGRRPVTDIFEPGRSHIDVTENLDVLVIAPATANTIAKLAAGLADCAVTTTVAAADCPIIICPAMNERMWRSAANRRNIAGCEELGYEIIGPADGDLACGGVGQGRLAGLGQIEAAVLRRLKSTRRLRGRKFIVTAGPTREYMDPVRFLSNPSSGKTGYAVADELSRRGGEVILISGPTNLTPPGRVKLIRVESAREMREEIAGAFADATALIMTAAVADHRFAAVSEKKVAKDDIPATVTLERNPDILREMGERKKPGQTIVGFAAQTHDAEESGRKKLTEKKVDLMVCTKVGPGVGFGAEDIEAIFISKDKAETLGKIDKKDLAAALADMLESVY